MAKRKSKLLVEYTDLFGVTMDIKNMSEVFHLSRQSIYNLISAEKMPFYTFRIRNLGGKGKRLAHTADVVRFIEAQDILDN